MRKKINEIKNRLHLFGERGKWQDYLVKVLLSDIFWVLFIGGLVRLYYYSNFKDSFSETDSPTYVNPVFNIFKGEVDMWRTPVYPYFLRIIRYFSTPETFLHSVFLVQAVISFLACIVFYKLVKTVFRSRKVKISAALLFAISPSIVSYDKCVLTESLSISLLVFFTGLLLLFLKRPSALKAAILMLVIFFSIMLRPSFLILLIVFTLFWLVRMFTYKNQWRSNLTGILGSFVVIAFLIGYAHLNYKRNGYHGITAVTNFNQLYFLVDHDMYSNGNDADISEVINKTLQDPAEDVWHTKTMSAVFNNFSQVRIAEFNSNSIKNQPLIYLRKVFNIFYNSTKEKLSYYKPHEINYAQRYNYFANLFDFILNINLIPFLFVYFLLLVDFLFNTYRLFKTKKIQWFNLLIWTLVTSHLTLLIFNGGGQIARLFVTMLPLAILIFFYYIDLLIASFKFEKSSFKKYIA